MNHTIRHISLLSIIILIALQHVQGQSATILSIEDAVATAVQQNYGIQIARKNVEIARNNADKTLLGYKPTVNANGGLSARLGGSSQIDDSGTSTTENNVFNYTGNAAITGSYTLFDKSREYSLAQVQEVLTLSDLQLRQTIEFSVLQLTSQYYALANLVSNLSVLEENLALSRQRWQRIAYQFEYGQGTRLDVLNAEVDMQRDSINYFNASQQLDNAKRSFNVILGRAVSTDFDLDTMVVYQEGLELSTLLEKANSNNVELLIADKSIDIRRIDLDIIDSGKKPTISSSLSYGYNAQGIPAGMIPYGDTRGFSAGVTLGWNLFDGGIRKIRQQNVLIELESQSLSKDLLGSEIERDIRNAWESYQNALYILEAEKVSLRTNQLNFSRTEDQLRLGQINSVQYRQAQLNLANAKTNLNEAKFNAKIIEIELIQLSGEILN